MSRVTVTGRAMAFGGTLAVASILIAGCTPVNGPVAIGTIDGRFRVAVCDDLVVDEAYATVREAGGELEIVWEVQGQVTIQPGAVATLAEDPFGMEVVSYREPRFGPGDRLQFTFLGNPDANTGTLAYFTVPEGGVEDGLWLTPDGEIQRAPCE